MSKKKRATARTGATADTTPETPQNGAAPEQPTEEQPGVTLTPEEMKLLGALRKAKDDPSIAGSDTILRMVQGWIETNEMMAEDWATMFAPPAPVGELEEEEEEVIRQFRYRTHVSGPWYRAHHDLRIEKRNLADPQCRRAWMLFGQLIEAGYIEMPNLDIGGHLSMFELAEKAEQIHSDVQGLVWILDRLDSQ
jgi:hypothetical protein